MKAAGSAGRFFMAEYAAAEENGVVIVDNCAVLQGKCVTSPIFAPPILTLRYPANMSLKPYAYCM